MHVNVYVSVFSYLDVSYEVHACVHWIFVYLYLSPCSFLHGFMCKGSAFIMHF